MTLKMKIFNILQFILATATSFLFSLIFSYFGWIIVIKASTYLEEFGISFALVGDAGEKDPGAIIVGIVYILLLALISYFIMNKTKFKIFAQTLFVTGIFFSFHVFAIVSSLIWF